MIMQVVFNTGSEEWFAARKAGTAPISVEQN